MATVHTRDVFQIECLIVDTESFIDETPYRLPTATTLCAVNQERETLK